MHKEKKKKRGEKTYDAIVVCKWWKQTHSIHLLHNPIPLYISLIDQMLVTGKQVACYFLLICSVNSCTLISNLLMNCLCNSFSTLFQVWYRPTWTHGSKGKSGGSFERMGWQQSCSRDEWTCSGWDSLQQPAGEIAGDDFPTCNAIGKHLQVH